MQVNMSSSIHVLIVDQDKEVRNLFGGFLKSQGFTISLASNPAEALENVKQRLPNIIFSAIVFQGTNGFELCRKLRAMPETAETPIIALTGYCAEGILAEAAKAGFTKYMLKPVNIEVMLSILQSLPH